MKTSERLVNIAFGFSILYWGVAGFLAYNEGLNTPFIRFFITLLNLTVGFLILFRKPVIKSGSLKAVLYSLPSLVCGGLIFKLALPLNQWSLVSELLFTLGASMALLSFLMLGRNFSIFPGLRSVVSGGFYKIVRHPSFLGESLMLTGCLMAADGWLSLIPFLLFIPTIALRIKEEESLLLYDQGYLEYTRQVRWRLIPGVW